MILTDLYTASAKKKETKKISEFFDELSIDNKELLEISDNAINNGLIENNNELAHINVYNDLEIFSDTESVFDSINRCNTNMGTIILKNILKNPTSDINELKSKQKILNVFINNTDLFTQISVKLQELSKLEPSLLWIYRDQSKEEKRIIESVYFKNKFLTSLNKNETVLLLYNYFTIVFSPLYGILTPVFFFIAPYLYLRFFTNVRFDFKLYFKMLKTSFFGTSGGNNMFGTTAPPWSRYISLLMSIFMYCHNIYNSVEISINTNNIINQLHTKLNAVSKYLELFEEIFDKTDKILNNNRKINRCFKGLKDKLFSIEPCLFSNKGKILVEFDNIMKNKKEFQDIFNYIGTVDSYISVVQLYKEFNKSRCVYCLPNFVEDKKPILNIRDIWHPYLSPKNVVGNDINIGDSNPNNIIITGPNAGGKSTFIKSLTLGILFAQTLGIVAANSFEFTPFSIINTYLNIPDCKGKESLFEAEMHRAKEHIKILDNNSENKFSFVVMDEIFSSTNPEEGIAGGYAIAEKLSSYKNSIACITTHFSYITNLEKTSDYKNYKIPITRDEDKNIIYPYKLKKGISDQFIALELLKQKGFDNHLVERALSVCERLDLSKVFLNDKKVLGNSESIDSEINLSKESKNITIENESNLNNQSTDTINTKDTINTEETINTKETINIEENKKTSNPSQSL